MTMAGCEMIYQEDLDSYTYKITSYADAARLAKALNMDLVKTLDTQEQKDFDGYCKAWNQATAWLDTDNGAVKLFYEF